MTRHAHTPEGYRQLLGQLNAYIDGELAQDRCDALEAHLDGCDDCRALLDSLTRTIALYRWLRELPIDLPPAVEARLMRRLEHSTPAAEGEAR